MVGSIKDLVDIVQKQKKAHNFDESTGSEFGGSTGIHGMGQDVGDITHRMDLAVEEIIESLSIILDVLLSMQVLCLLLAVRKRKKASPTHVSTSSQTEQTEEFNSEAFQAIDEAGCGKSNLPETLTPFRAIVPSLGDTINPISRNPNRNVVATRILGQKLVSPSSSSFPGPPKGLLSKRKADEMKFNDDRPRPKKLKLNYPETENSKALKVRMCWLP